MPEYFCPAIDTEALRKSEITASVVLYKTPDSQLARLLDSIQNSSIRVHTVLVDNSPTESHLACIDRPGVTYFWSQSNRGYGAGHNVVLREVLNTARLHFVLNPDVYFGPEELEKMVRFVENDPSIGQLMPKVTYPDGSLQYLCKLIPSPADLFLRRFAFGPLRPVAEAARDDFELRHTGYDRIMDVPYLSGCFMLFRTLALRRVGLFDERFFMYPEDIDMSRRMHAEFRTVFYPESTVVHDHARESYKSRKALWIHISNLVRYYNKWGWLRDPQRSKFNRETLERLRSSHSAPADGVLGRRRTESARGDVSAARRVFHNTH